MIRLNHISIQMQCVKTPALWVIMTYTCFLFSMVDKFMHRISNEHDWICLSNESYAAAISNMVCMFLLLYQVLCVFVCACIPVVNTKHNRKLITLIVNIHCGIRIKSKLLMGFLLFSLFVLFCFCFKWFSLVSRQSSRRTLMVSKQLISLGLHPSYRHKYNILIDCHRVWSDRRSAC